MVIVKMQTKTNLFVTVEAATLLPHLQTFLAYHDIEAYFVGGFVRDGLLGKPNHDIDLAVFGDAVSIAKQAADVLNGHFVLLDELHQVARVVLSPNEERWYLDFASMRGPIEEDLAKRDFTIDAIAVRPGQMEAGWNRVKVTDPLDGIGDLERRLVRAASDSAFADDPARLLRAFRLAAEFGFSIDAQTESIIERDNELITGVSGERIREELGHILETDQAAKTLRHLDRLGIFDLLFPEMSASKGVEQPKEHFWDVFEHSMETVAAVEQLLTELNSKNGLLELLSFRDELREHFEEKVSNGLRRGALIKIAALLHDVAKPQTKSFDAQKGKFRFLGHAPQGAKIAEAILERLRFSSREKGAVTRIIDQHLRPGHLSNAHELPTRRAIYRYFRDTGDVGIDTLFLSLADHLATRGPSLEAEGWQKHVQVTQYMLAKRLEEGVVVSPPKLLDGHVLISEFGLAPGPEIGKLLETIREAQASGEIESKEDALDFVRKELDRKYANQR